MPNKSRVYVMGGGGGVVGAAPRWWNNFSKLEGSQVMSPGIDQKLFDLPVPAGVNVGYAFSVVVAGFQVFNGTNVLQELWMIAQRDALGALIFNAANDINVTTRFGAGVNIPILSGGASDANNIWPTFNQVSEIDIFVAWVWTRSPALPLTLPTPPPPVP